MSHNVPILVLEDDSVEGMHMAVVNFEVTTPNTASNVDIIPNMTTITIEDRTSEYVGH